MGDPFLAFDRISKAYGGFTAVEAVSFRVSTGEVIGLVGENGAGKSTLMKILGGVVAPSAGAIVIDGEAHPRLTVEAASRAGVAFVHQELNLFDNLTVAANVFVGREPTRGGPLRLVDDAALERRTAPLLAQLGAGFPPSARVSDLSLAERQIVEIAKALSQRARLLILDEPTSSLTSTETERLLAVVDRLRAEGVAVILISHRLGEVERLADRVLVLRDGRLVAELARSEITPAAMIRHMIGRDLKALHVPPAAPPGAAVLRLEGVRTTYRPDRAIDLSVRRGEILGLAGLIGSGRTELARTLFGLDPLLGGTVRIDGTVVSIDGPRAAIAAGLYLVPEDRKRCGLVLDFPIRENVTLASLWRFARRGLVRTDAEEAEARRQIDRLDIRAEGTGVACAALSGGNQQKVVLAKWLSMAPRVMVFDEPTRGVDVGAKAEIYRRMRDLADAGVGVLMISSDMEEIVGVSDRVAVMHEGGIAGFLDRDGLGEHAVLSLAVGRSTS